MCFEKHLKTLCIQFNHAILDQQNAPEETVWQIYVQHS